MFHTCFQHYYTLVLDSVIIMFQSAQHEDHGRHESRSVHHVAQGPPVHGGLHSHPAQTRADHGPPVHGRLHSRPAQTRAAHGPPVHWGLRTHPAQTRAAHHLSKLLREKIRKSLYWW